MNSLFLLVHGLKPVKDISFFTLIDLDVFSSTLDD
jgi:hypothetical protein